MRAVPSLVILALVAIVLYLCVFRNPAQVVYHNFSMAAETPTRSLSSFVDANLDKIFCPLTPDQTLMPTQELREFQQTLLDLRSNTKSDRERRLYDEGLSVCKQMIEAITVREAHNRRIADMRKKGYDTQLSDPKNKKIEEKKKKDFFEASVMRSWEAQATKSREITQTHYDQMRQMER